MLGNKRGELGIKQFLIILASAIILWIAVVLIFILPGQNRSFYTSGVPTCGDGSFYNTCSLDKPYYCSRGILVANPLACGCPDSLTKSGNSCTSKYQTNQSSMVFHYVLNGRNMSVNYTLYGGFADYLSTLPDSITYTDGQQPQKSDFVLMKLNNPIQQAFIEPLVKQIENLAPTDKVTQARIAISLVQNIPWGSSGKTVNFGAGAVNYSRYPYEVLYDNQGLCGEKSELLVFLLRDLGYGTALFYYPQENHETAGIKCPVQESVGGTGYCFIEASGPAILSDDSLVYVGGVTLSESPEVVLISDGISLPDNLPEYNDARTLESLSGRSWLDPISSAKLSQLEQKYGLGQAYKID
ncbi:MAG: hypothetical protein KGH55_00360 [Nanoarchaeota archaeon]|nr:hypothetical protein [Nanoarchaeota archaeon]